MITITLDNPILEVAAATLTAKINANRPRDKDGKFINPPQTVVDVLSANLASIVASWKEAQDAAAREAMIPVTNEILEASPEKQSAAIAAALKEIRS